MLNVLDLDSVNFLLSPFWLVSSPGRKMTFAFERLLVYQKSVDFADAVCCETERFSRGYGFLVDQLNRASLSIAANIAEGNGQAALEYVRAELPQQGLLDKPHWMLVEVFDPAAGTWEQRRKDHIKPGEEFRAMNLLFKQVMYDGLSEIHGEVDVNNMDDAYAAFDPGNVRNPTPDDVVYVLGEPLPKGGFHTLGYLGPNQWWPPYLFQESV